MRDNNIYNGLVTFNFYDKEGNLKKSHKQHNRGTPYFFYVIEKILQEGTKNIVDSRPGKIMLTSPGAFTYTPSTNIISLSCESQLKIPIPKDPRVILSAEDGFALLDDESGKNYIYQPFIRYSFNISYYDLKNLQGISDLDKYRFWLLSADENEFNDDSNGNISVPLEVGSFTESDDKDIKVLLDNISLTNIRDNIPKILAEVQLNKEQGSDTDYSLNENEYISVIWDIYFTNFDIEQEVENQLAN